MHGTSGSNKVRYCCIHLNLLYYSRFISISESSLLTILKTAFSFSSESIATGNMPIALPTPGGAGQYTLPLGELSFLQSAGAPIVPIVNTQSVPNTNTSPNAPFNPLSLASWETYGSEVPGYIASTAANLAKSLGSIPGYTPGGAPTAGGQFPNNYPITQTNITNNIMVQRTIYK
ncbi:MAG: hypothetical protein M1331_02205 [Candidatus Marsarchaeota archaeon]|nr:hypothetical protein [Candidatus Marsarchaeota archaeon]